MFGITGMRATAVGLPRLLALVITLAPLERSTSDSVELPEEIGAG